jgi:Flp pilus assembly protein TadG
MNYPQRHRSMRGVAAVELALVTIPLVIMTLAAIDFARAIFTYDQLIKATRDGARYLSMFDPSRDDYPIQAARSRMISQVRDLADTMIIVCDRQHTENCTGGPFGDVSTGGGSGTINLVKVTIRSYVFRPIFPGASQLAPTITFEPISTTMPQLL